MPEDSDLPPEEESALAALSRGAAPDPGLEDRIVADLRRRGLLRRRRSFGWNAVAVAAAALLLFVGGFLAGRTSVGRTDMARDLATVRADAVGKQVTRVVWF